MIIQSKVYLECNHLCIHTWEDEDFKIPDPKDLPRIGDIIPCLDCNGEPDMITIRVDQTLERT